MEKPKGVSLRDPEAVLLVLLHSGETVSPDLSLERAGHYSILDPDTKYRDFAFLSIYINVGRVKEFA